MASKYIADSESDDEPAPQGLIAAVKHLLLTPFRIVFSKTAQRAYLTTFLVISTCLFLFALAVTAYALFYWSYIPRIGFERTIHLQFDNVLSQLPAKQAQAHPYPYGTVSLASDVISGQEYDVKVELAMPRTRENRDAGNFMLEMEMVAPGEKGGLAKEAGGILDAVREGVVPGSSSSRTVLARSRRPAILPYRSIAVEMAYRLSELHWYILGFRSEVDSLTIPMFEKVEFERGWRNVPATLKLEVQSTHRMQIYGAKAVFRARFKGLRWLMYNHRIISAFAFITAFWTTEVVFAGVAWAAVAFALSQPDGDFKAEEVHEVAERIKQEPEDDDEAQAAVLSDTERTFPTLSGQKALRYSSPSIKQESEEPRVSGIPETPGKVAEADDEDDDEDEDADFFLDSGIGTSLDSSAGRRDSVRKRRTRMGRGRES